MSDQEPVNAGQLARAIEPASIAAWPARETRTLHGWLLRFTNGFTHRGNSVATLAFDGGDVSAAIAQVEAEYRMRSLAPMFQIASAAAPHDLRAMLHVHGYEVVTPTHVLLGEPASVRDRLPSPGMARVSREPD